MYEHGDYVKVVFESSDETPGELMWVIVESVDADRKIVFGRLDNDSLNTPGLHVGKQLAIAFDKIVDHRKPTEITRQ